MRSVILLLALTSCGPAVVPTVTMIGAVAGTVGTTDQLGITGLADWMALKKPAACGAGK